MAKRRRKRVEQNPLSRGQKAAIIGGIALAGGAAALYLTRAPQQAPAAPPPDPVQSKSQECAALQASLQQLRSRPTPDVQEVQRLEQQVAACIAQARELGAPVDNATAQQSTGDQSFQQVEAKQGEYKATDYSDAVKRNNLRKEMLAAGSAMATAYQAAVTQATTDESVQLARLSILRALDSAIQRRLCYLYDQPGCGRFGVNEDHGNDKAAQEQAQVVAPLIAAHSAAIQKLGGPSALRIADGLDKWISALVRGAQTTKGFIDQKFAEYKATDYSDAVRRNNLRQEILGKGADLEATLSNAFTEARKFRYLQGLRMVASATIDGLNASIDRVICFRVGGPGCGTFAVNEDQPDVKSAQEHDRVTRPLMDLARRIADAMTDLGDTSMFPRIVAAKMRLATFAADSASAKFGEYVATDWSDAIKRNNLRQDVLGFASDAAARLQDALGVAVAGATAKPSTTTQIASSVSPTASRTAAALAVRPLLTVRPTAAMLPARTTTATSGLGQTSSLLLAARSFRPSTLLATSIVVPADHVGAIRSVAQAVQGALDAAVSRKLCYQYDGTGCGRFGVNEADNASKADDEQNRVIAPLLATARAAAKFLVTKGDANAEIPFTNIVTREVTAARDYMDGQYGNLKATDYVDQLKRGNLRGDIIRAGQRAVAALRNAKPATDAGKAALRAVAQDMLNRSREREACYRAGAPGCGRLDDAGDAAMRIFTPGYAASPREDGNDAKADQEAAEIGRPLAALLADKAALAGLGDDAAPGVPTWLWVTAGAGLVAAVMYAQGRPRVRPNRRKPRRTSRARK